MLCKLTRMHYATSRLSGRYFNVVVDAPYGSPLAARQNHPASLQPSTLARNAYQECRWCKSVRIVVEALVASQAR